MVEYNRRRRLDTSRVKDRRGASGGRRGPGMAVGGAGGLILLVIALLTGADPSSLLGGGDPAPAPPPANGGLASCEVGADIATNRDCRFVAFENSIQEYWARQFEGGLDAYPPASLTTFTGAVDTGCGRASSAVGPFYCPADRGAYLDLGFFDTLERQLGARGGDFAEAYVLAHEFGHHIQNVTGYMEQVQTREGPTSDAVRLELQADCLAGMWAGQATLPGPDGEEPVIVEITSDDIDRALDAASTVGDDYIQSRTQGTVTPETWTHGSAEQRRRWFEVGFTTGDFAACDTFRTSEL